MNIRISTVTILFLLLLSLVPFSLNAQSEKNELRNYNLNEIELTRVEEYILDLQFVGFDQELISEDDIKDNLYHYFPSYSSHARAHMNYTYEFSYMSTEDTLLLENYLLSIAEVGEGVGYTLNITQLQSDLITRQRNDIFIPADGMTFDVKLVEEFLYNNLYNPPASDKPGYTLFIFNFSKFDSYEDKIDHYYFFETIGYDSNRTTDWWYSGYRNLDRRQAIGFGGEHRFCFVDLSAQTWYFDWIKTAWSGFTTHGWKYYQYPDIDALTRAVDLSTGSGKLFLNQYIAEFIYGYMGNLFGLTLTNPPIAQSVSMQAKVFYNLTDAGYPLEETKWVLSEERILTQLEKDFPWIDWHISVEYVSLDDYPDLYDYIKENYKPETNVLEVWSEFFYMLQNQLSDHFDYSIADILLPCYTFLNDEIGFSYLGTQFAGLGGMGWQILVGNQYSIYEYGDTNKPLRGMTDVMIHELGHSLGFPHPHSGSNGWVSDMVQEVMSYFSPIPSFSVFFRDILGRTHGDFYYYRAQVDYEAALDYYYSKGSPTGYQNYMDDIEDQLNNYITNYRAMDYPEAIQNAFQAILKTEEFVHYIDYPNTDDGDNQTTPLNVALFPILTALILLIRKKRR